jgi:hypothetical protein
VGNALRGESKRLPNGEEPRMSKQRTSPKKNPARFNPNAFLKTAAKGRIKPRHGLTTETVLGALEDAEDYKGFEAHHCRGL